LLNGLSELAEELSLQWRWRSTGNQDKVMLLASMLDHCLIDLLYRQRMGV